jgi:SAM-dependent methyltransferase
MVSAHEKIESRFYPEVNIAGFTQVDGTIVFYSQIAAILDTEHRLLDFGAGRGEPISDDPVSYRSAIQNFKGRVAHVEGVDPDEVVLTNPYLDHGTVIPVGAKLPFEDNSFDIIVSRSVFEHVDTPELTASDLMRVLKPGGWLFAMTPNKWGYVAIAARIVPNKKHVKLLESIQPGRKAEDIFPTRYKMNTKSSLKRLFAKQGQVYIFRFWSEPAYHFNNNFVFAFFKLLHKILPDFFAVTLGIAIRKNI